MTSHHRTPLFRFGFTLVCAGLLAYLAVPLSASLRPPTAPTTAPTAATITASRMGWSAPGTTKSYTHVLSNQGAIPETFHMVVGSRNGWSTSVSPTQVTVNPGQNATITASLTIPANADPGIEALLAISVTNTVPAPPIFLRVNDTVLVASSTALKIPPAQWGASVGGRRVYSLTEIISTTEFLAGRQTRTYGYNGTFLGPTLVITHGEAISISVTNNLTETSTTHWHGLHLPGQMDGGPHQEIAVGETWRPNFTVVNEASTVWYHPHPHEHDLADAPSQVYTATTGNQVYYGLAGMILIRDSESTALGLPQTYGVDEFPIVIQDRNFNADGSFRPYPILQDRDLHKGNFFLVNGTLAGNLDVPAQMVRFHILNGSNARFYNFGFSDNRSFYQIASDNALLNQPVTRTRVVLGSGERAEIVVNLSGMQGQTLYFGSYNSEFDNNTVAFTSVDDFDQSNFALFALHVTGQTPNPVTTLASTLNDTVRIDPDTAIVTNTLILMIPPSINGRTFEMDVINITNTLGTNEIWSIVNQSEETHPLHIHDSPFQILTRDGVAPPAYELGWKDTVLIHPGEQVNLIKQFSGWADPMGPFMYHCHILDHEDKGMMGQFIIIGQSIYLPIMSR